MNFRVITVLLCLLSVSSGADIDSLLRDAVAAEARQDSRKALELLQEAERAKPNNALIFQKIARQYSDLVVSQPTTEEKKRYAQTALEYSERAVALEPKDPVNILSLAVCHGKLALYSDTKEKVRYSRLVRDEAEQALALDPNYAWAHHVLGRWHCEVASLGAPSRVFVKLFYGALPAASVEEGIRHLQQAKKLEPTELNHWLELGFAYAADGQKDLARTEWKHGLEMPSRGPHDEPAKQRARDALAKLN